MPHKWARCKKRNRRDFESYLRKILSPAAWKTLHQAVGDFEEQRSRWTLQPLLIVGLVMALDDAPTLRERFESAQELCGVFFPKRRRCGYSVEGYLVALAVLPLGVFWALRRTVQNRLRACGIDAARVGRWKAYGVDGTKQNLPRTTANERKFGVTTKEPGVPQRVVVGVVALGKRLLWDWEAGDAHASERELAREAIKRLEEEVLIVADAGFVGYEWMQAVLKNKKHLLLRIGANVRLWAEQIGEVEEHGGEVWLWPDHQHRQAPLRLRVIRLERLIRTKGKRGKKRRKAKREVIFLVTDVLEEEELSQEEARTLFALRWPGNEGTFRSWKCTMECENLISRTPMLAERECNLSLLALMTIQVLTHIARKEKRKAERKVSVAQAQRVWRKAVRWATARRSTQWFGEELTAAVVDNYERKTPKVKRHWARRKEHNIPKMPKFRKLTKKIKRLGLRRLEAA